VRNGTGKKRGRPEASGHRNLRQVRHRLLDQRGRVFVILQLALVELLVGRHVEVAGEVEGDHFLFAALPGTQGLVDRHADGVRGLGRGEDAFRLGELHRRFEGGVPVDDLRIIVRSPRARASAMAAAITCRPTPHPRSSGAIPMAATRLVHPRRAISTTPAGAPSRSYTRLA